MASRGPPKGYTKALERRLQETELVLTRLLLSTTDKDSLTLAFHDDTQEQAHVFHKQFTEHHSSGTSEQKKLALMDHWERFPLRTVNNVRQWIEEVTKDPIVQDGVEMQPNEKTQELLQTERSSGNINHQPMADIQSPASTGDDLAIESPCHALAVVQGPISRTPLEIASSVDTIQPPAPAAKAHEVQNITASYEIGLPPDFKHRFLW